MTHANEVVEAAMQKYGYDYMPCGCVVIDYSILAFNDAGRGAGKVGIYTLKQLETFSGKHLLAKGRDVANCGWEIGEKGTYRTITDRAGDGIVGTNGVARRILMSDSDISTDMNIVAAMKDYRENAERHISYYGRLRGFTVGRRLAIEKDFIGDVERFDQKLQPRVIL